LIALAEKFSGRDLFLIAEFAYDHVDCRSLIRNVFRILTVSAIFVDLIPHSKIISA